MPTYTILDSDGIEQEVVVPELGQDSSAGSIPFALSTEQEAILSAIVAAAEAQRPATTIFSIVPSDDDNDNFDTPTRGIYVGGAGDIAVVIGTDPFVFSAVPAGTILPVVADRVDATNTTATLLLGLR